MLLSHIPSINVGKQEGDNGGSAQRNILDSVFGSCAGILQKGYTKIRISQGTVQDSPNRWCFVHDVCTFTKGLKLNLGQIKGECLFSCSLSVLLPFSLLSWKMQHEGPFHQSSFSQSPELPQSEIFCYTTIDIKHRSHIKVNKTSLSFSPILLIR